MCVGVGAGCSVRKGVRTRLVVRVGFEQTEERRENEPPGSGEGMFQAAGPAAATAHGRSMPGVCEEQAQQQPRPVAGACLGCVRSSKEQVLTRGRNALGHSRLLTSCPRPQGIQLRARAK